MRERASLSTLVLLLLIALSGCGGDTDGGEPGAQATVTQTVSGATDATADPTEVTSAPEPSDDEPDGPPEVAPQPGRGEGGDDQSPTTYVAGLDRVVAALSAVGPQELSRFVTPSDNIYCVIDDDVIPPSCEISVGGVRDPAVCIESPSPVVGRLELTGGTATAVCNSDTIRTAGPPLLGYGGVATWAGSPVQCLVEEIGVTCVDRVSRQGFFVAKGTYRLLLSR